MSFEAPASDYQLTYDKKKTARIRFKTRTDEDLYTLDLRIFPGGSATIGVTPVHKQAIQYQGELIPTTPAADLPAQP